MALTDEEKAFLIKIGQDLPKEVKEIKQQKETITVTPTQETEV
jgi:hypothetical protein